MRAHEREQETQVARERRGEPEPPAPRTSSADSLLALQRAAGNHAVGRLIQRYPYIDSSPPSTDDAQIYGIYPQGKLNKPPVYVGQTSWDRAGNRFQEHCRNDSAAAWYYGNFPSGAYDDEDDAKWPYTVRNVVGLKGATRFEVTVAEQWVWEYFGGRAQFPAQVQPMKNATFHKYAGIAGNYDLKHFSGTGVRINKNWEPTDQ